MAIHATAPTKYPVQAVRLRISAIGLVTRATALFARLIATQVLICWPIKITASADARGEIKMIFISGSAPGASSTCYGFDKRRGSCNSTCNCGNQASCLAQAKAGCVWTGEACVRQYVNSTNGECNCQCGVVMNKIPSDCWIFHPPPHTHTPSLMQWVNGYSNRRGREIVLLL